MKSEKIEELVFEKLNLKAEPNSAGDLTSYYLPLIGNVAGNVALFNCDCNRGSLVLSSAFRINVFTKLNTMSLFILSLKSLF